MNQENQSPKQKNSFLDVFRFTKNGKPQSAALVMTFSYSMLFLAVYLICYFLLIDRINSLLDGQPVWLENLMESLVPAVVGAVLCALPMIWVKEKRYVPMAYVWLGGYAAAAFAAIVIGLRAEPEARTLFVKLFAMTVLVPLVLGGGLAGWLYRRYQKSHPPLEYSDGWKRP